MTTTTMTTIAQERSRTRKALRLTAVLRTAGATLDDYDHGRIDWALAERTGGVRTASHGSRHARCRRGNHPGRPVRGAVMSSDPIAPARGCLLGLALGGLLWLVIGLIAAVVAHAAPADDADAQLPAEWTAGDFGTPVEWNGTTLRIYADINDGDRRFARNAVAVDGQFMIQPLVSYEPDTFYWITDGTELPDGTLLVVALEVINRHDLPQDGWQFEVIDTDAFIVREPTDHASWTIASKLNKIEDGWWGTDQVEFSDQWPGMAFGREVYGQANRLYSFDVTDVAAGEQVSRLPSSDGPFAPVQTENGWFGYSWSWTENTATLWQAADVKGEWTEVTTTSYEQQTHAHGLNVVGGDVVHRWSVFTERPAYEAVDL